MNFGEHRTRVESGVIYSAQRKEALTQVIAVMKERVSIEKDTAKRFARLAEWQFSAFNTPGLTSLVSGLKTAWETHAHHSKALAESIEKEVIQPLNYFLSIQTEELKVLTQRVKDIVTAVKGKIVQAEKSKNRYMKACRETESLAASLGSRLKMREEARNKTIGKIAAGKNDIVATEAEYQQSITELSSFSIDYTAQLVLPTQGVCFADLAKLDHARCDRFRLEFSRLLTLEVSKLRRIIEDKENAERPIDAFNPDEEILIFALNSSQKIPQICSVEFAPYSGEHPMFRVNTMRMVRCGEDWVDVIREGTDGNFNGEVEAIVSKACPTTRRALVTSLNRRRPSKFSIPPPGFSVISQLVSLSLEISWQEGDLEAVRDLILTSQTFYMAQTNPRLFLSERVKESELMRSKKFWLGYIDYALGNDVKKGDTVGQEVVSAQLGACLLTMQTFGCCHELVSEVGTEIAERYKIPARCSSIVLPQIQKIQAQSLVVSHSDFDPLGVRLESSEEATKDPVA